MGAGKSIVDSKLFIDRWNIEDLYSIISKSQARLSKALAGKPLVSD
jgi:hypothetical protein